MTFKMVYGNNEIKCFNDESGRLYFTHYKSLIFKLLMISFFSTYINSFDEPFGWIKAEDLYDFWNCGIKN